jgi:hypothetical protein
MLDTINSLLFDKMDQRLYNYLQEKQAQRGEDPVTPAQADCRRARHGPRSGDPGDEKVGARGKSEAITGGYSNHLGW